MDVLPDAATRRCKRLDLNKTRVPYPSGDSHLERRRVGDALDLLRSALVEYLTALPRTSRTAFGNADVQALLDAFIERFREFTLPSHVRTLAFSARDALNEIAHYVGAMSPDVALRHLLNIRQLLKDLGTESAFVEVDRLYNDQLRPLRTREDVRGKSTGHTSVVHFDGDDGAYFAWLARNPEGYVVNVRRRCSPDYVVLHRASCGHVANPREAGAYTERDYGKLCAPTREGILDAPTFCGRAKGSFTKQCAHCWP